MVRRIVMVLWGVIRLLLRLIRIIRCGALMGVVRLIRLWLVVWVARVCWVRAHWVCVVRPAWARVAWAPRVLAGSRLVPILGLGLVPILRLLLVRMVARARVPLV